MGLQVFAGDIGFYRQHEAKFADHAGLRHGGDVKTVRAFVQRQLDGMIFHDQRQPLTQHQHQFAEAKGEIVMVVYRQYALCGTLRRPGGEFRGKRQPASPERFRVKQRQRF